MDNTEPKQWPRYQSHKQVSALRIEGVDHVAGPAVQLSFADSSYPPVVLQPVEYARYTPQVGDYVVRYDDNYQSVSPRKAFEDGYTRLPE